MHLNIKNDEAHKLATELARLTGENLTSAVTLALRERMARERRRRRTDDVAAPSTQQGIANDAENLRRLGHQAKGALGNFAARKAVAAARTLEEIGASANLGTAPAALVELREEIRQVLAALAELLAS